MAVSINIPESLRTWFFIHFLLDYIVAIPIFLFPDQTLILLGWQTIDPIAARLVAAALFGIGGVSLISMRSEAIVYKHLLLLKIVWSLFAVAGILFTASVANVPFVSWIVLTIFVFFAVVWIYYYYILSRSINKIKI